MTAKIVEVIARILDGLNNNISLEEVNDQLTIDKEYDKQTVSAAFSLVYDKVLTSKIVKDKSNSQPQNIRLLTDEERDVLGIDNYDYLLKLWKIGLVDSADLEIILEQLMLFPNEAISREDINWIILVSLVEFNSKILPGSRILLYSSDTIN
jgi:uncharacterized protein Smg (DUF494 family)